MKIVTKSTNIVFEDEEDEQIVKEERSEDDIAEDQEPDQELDQDKDSEQEDKNDESDEEDNDDEGDEVEDDEDFVEDNENLTNNTSISKEAKQRVSLSGSNKKISLKKPLVEKSKKPTTQKLVDEAIKELNERAGSSSRAIQKFILNRHPTYDEKRLGQQIRRYVKKCVIAGTMIQIKQSYKLTPESKKKIIKIVKPQAKKEKETEKKKLNKEKVGPKQGQKTSEKSEKSKEIKKTVVKIKKSDQKPEEKAKITKIAKITKEAKKQAEPTAVAVKVAKQTKSSKTAKAKENTAKTEKPKPKTKLVRKSINLVVRKTSPRAKITKKNKITATPANKKATVLKALVDSAPTTSAAAMKANKKAKNK